MFEKNEFTGVFLGEIKNKNDIKVKLVELTHVSGEKRKYHIFSCGKIEDTKHGYALVPSEIKEVIKETIKC